MNFGANKTAVEVIKEGALRGTYSGINGLEKWFRKSWKEFDELKNIDQIDYSISPKIRQILLPRGYELVENDLFFCSYKSELLLV